MGSSKMTYTKLTTDDGAYITVFVPGLDPLPASEDHPNWVEIDKLTRKAEKAYGKGNIDKAERLVEKLVDLFDIAMAVQRKFESISDSGRVTVRSGKVYFDGDEITGLLVDHIVQAMEEGADFAPLVKFYENLASNPLGHSREALYPWMEGQGGFTITPEGNVVGYKSVYKTEDENGAAYKPTRDGGGIVNGVEVRPIIQREGDVVEMARSIVLHSPSTACAEGLHIGTWGYASTFSGDTILEVHFNPRDVVSVPNGENKIRVCRYTVVKPVEKAYTQAILGTPERPEDEDDEDRCTDCGYPVDECECEDTDRYARCGDPDCPCAEDPDAYDPDADDVETMLDGDTKPTLDEINELIDAGRDFVDTLTQAAQDARDDLGRWVAGRKSERDPSTGRFIG